MYYENSRHAPSEFWAGKVDASEDKQLLTDLEAVEKKVVCRENDILLLKHNLLLEPNIGVLFGRAGTGKTDLLKFLAQWWRMTNFISGTIWFDALEMDTREVPRLLRYVILGDSKGSQEEPVKKMFLYRYLVVFDSWESVKFPDTSTISKQESHLKIFLRTIHESRGLVMFISRRSEGRLSRLGHGKAAISQVLESLSPIHGIQFATSLLANPNKSESLSDDEDKSYLECFVKLAEGNPLILQILAKDFSRKEVSIKQYYNDLLDDATVTFDGGWFENEEGARSVFQLRNIAHDLLSPSNEVLSMRWIDTHLRIAIGEVLYMRNYCHAIPLTIFALTWGAMPTQDLW